MGYLFKLNEKEDEEKQAYIEEGVNIKLNTAGHNCPSQWLNPALGPSSNTKMNPSMWKCVKKVKRHSQGELIIKQVNKEGKTKPLAI